MQKFGIYIHWPFCLSKCPYCDFFSQTKRNTPQEDIVAEYLSDLDFYHQMTSDQAVSSIFFGGGTPSLIEPQNIEKIISHITNKWKCTSNIEVSLEANPNTNHKNMFTDLSSAGINRLSLGIQSLNNKDLQFLGRTHNKAEALKAIDEVLKAFSNHSMDLIYALPHQAMKSWETELQTVVSLGFKHLSLYQLTIEEGAAFFKQGIKTLDEDAAVEMYEATTKILEISGYNRYETSNFAQKDFEAKHNLTYWEGYDYLGIGKSAHGRIGLNATTHRRLVEKITPHERAEELIIMGLRLKTGIDKARFFNICNINLDDFINNSKLESLISQKLLINDKNNLKTTIEGSVLTNFIIKELLC